MSSYTGESDKTKTFSSGAIQTKTDLTSYDDSIFMWSGGAHIWCHWYGFVMSNNFFCVTWRRWQLRIIFFFFCVYFSIGLIFGDLLWFSTAISDNSLFLFFFCTSDASTKLLWIFGWDEVIRTELIEMPHNGPRKRFRLLPLLLLQYTYDEIKIEKIYDAVTVILK